MSTPKISVVVTTYNQGHFIEEALQSVREQNYSNVDVIVVDDGSTDDTKARVLASLPSIRYIYQPNSGEAAARNTGILNSEGQFIAFLDADDAWLPHKLERQADLLLTRPEVGVGYTWWVHMDAAGRTLPETSRPNHEGNIFEKLLLGCFLRPSMCMIRRSCFESVGLYDTSLGNGTDWDLMLRVASAGYQFACVPEVLLRYRIHQDQISADPSKSLASNIAVVRKAIAALPAGPRREWLGNTAIGNLYISTAMFHARRNEWEAAVSLFEEALRSQPQQLERVGFYLSIISLLLPPGRRSWNEISANVDPVVSNLAAIVKQLLEESTVPAIARRKQIAWSNMLLALALLRMLRRQWIQAVTALLKAAWLSPGSAIAALGYAVQGLRNARISLTTERAPDQREPYVTGGL